MGHTVPAVCREAVGDIFGYTGHSHSVPEWAAVNASSNCTALQHPKETIQMKQTLDPEHDLVYEDWEGFFPFQNVNIDMYINQCQDL